MMIKTRMARLWLTGILTCLLCGCGSDGPDYSAEVVPVTGKISTSDGTPVANAQVFFVPTGDKGRAAEGMTDEAGKYTLTTQNGGPGAVPGDYNVSVSKFVTPDGSPVPEGTFPADVGAVESIPSAYSAYGQSRLKATVPEGGGELNLLLE